MTDSTRAPGRTGFTLTWRFDAPREQVFRAWTDPAHLDWFYNDEFPIPPEPIELDLRPGGAWRQMMVYTPDDRKWAGGIYREIVPPETLEFAFGAVGGWPDLSGDALASAPIVRLRFAEIAGGGTMLTLDTDLPDAVDGAGIRELLGAMRAGWTQTVGRLLPQLGGVPD